MSESKEAVAEAPTDVKMETRNVNVFYGTTTRSATWTSTSPIAA